MSNNPHWGEQKLDVGKATAHTHTPTKEKKKEEKKRTITLCSHGMTDAIQLGWYAHNRNTPPTSAKKCLEKARNKHDPDTTEEEEDHGDEKRGEGRKSSIFQTFIHNHILSSPAATEGHGTEFRLTPS